MTQQQNALDRVREIIKSKAQTAKVFGFGNELLAILDAVDEIASRIDLLGAITLKKHFGAIKLDSGSLERLVSLGPLTAGVVRVSDHKENCTCEHCTHLSLQKLKELGAL